MLTRIFVIAMNAYRESVRARLLLGLFGIGFATSAYSMIVGVMSLHQEARFVSDLGAASISLYVAVAAIVLGATSLHREIEQKTIFPILARPLRRHEYLLGKYFGALATLTAFIAVDASIVLFLLALIAGSKPLVVIGAAGLLLLILVVLLVRAKHTRVHVILPWSLALLLAMILLSRSDEGNQRLVLASISLTFFEACIVSAIAAFFSSFSTPFLTAIFSLGVFTIGRSADTLAHLSERQVGSVPHWIFAGIARVAPNLQLYVPARPVLFGEVSAIPIWPYVGTCAVHAIFYSSVLLVLAWSLFRKRDFT